MILRPPRALFVALLFGSFVGAQRTTWIVDAANGAGAHFTDLPPAVAVATDGDIVLVRAGSYTGFATGKALTVLGQGRVFVSLLPFPFAAPVIDVSGLPLGRRFVLKNVTVDVNAVNTEGVRVRDCDGLVHIEDLVVRGLQPLAAKTGLLVSDCDAVTVTGGRLEGRPAGQCLVSLLAMTGVDVAGGDGVFSRGVFLPATSGLNLFHSTVLLSRTNVQGGNGSWFVPGQSRAILSFGTDLTVTGDAMTRVRAGIGSGPATAAIDADYDTVVADTGIQIIGSSGGPPIRGTATVIWRRVASMWARGAGLQGRVDVEMVSPAGDPIQVVASVPSAPIHSPFGVVLVDANVIIPVFAGTQNLIERLRLGFPVPADARLRGAALVFQGAHLHTADNNRVEFTNPAVIVIG